MTRSSLVIYLISLSIVLNLFSFINLISLNSLDSNIDYFHLNTSLPVLGKVVIISDGHNGNNWNDGRSYDAKISIDIYGTIHVVWDDKTDGVWGTDTEIMYSNYNKSEGWSIPIVISDGFNGIYWNIGDSLFPDIATDCEGNIHVVWHDFTDGIWGTDGEIMYVKYSPSIGWSNPIVISDGFNGSYWNIGDSSCPVIVSDSFGNVHVAWYDYTNGIWGNDIEIMYANYSDSKGWSNVSVISDGFEGKYWNTDSSYSPAIASDSIGNIHIVWEDQSNGIWGDDTVIMYNNYKKGIGWSNITVISENFDLDTSHSFDADIAIDGNDKIHVVWSEWGEGYWGIDPDIMYVSYSTSMGWSNISLVSDGEGGHFWNNGTSTSPSIAAEVNGNIHVAWCDDTDGDWGTDGEIMYANYTDSKGWSSVSVISDVYSQDDPAFNWNNDNSVFPDITLDNMGDYHVVWTDWTNNPLWGNDSEIMYTTSSSPTFSSLFIDSSSFFFFIFFIFGMISLIFLIRKKVKIKTYKIV